MHICTRANTVTLTAEDCAPLPVERRADVYVSSWQPNDFELEMLKAGGVIELWVQVPENKHPPVAVTVAAVEPALMPISTQITRLNLGLIESHGKVLVQMLQTLNTLVSSIDFDGAWLAIGTGPADGTPILVRQHRFADGTPVPKDDRFGYIAIARWRNMAWWDLEDRPISFTPTQWMAIY